jgi:tetratricopeptide (TPR) repeat protein
MRGTNYQEIDPLLDMAKLMCEALQRGSKEKTPETPRLNKELETFLCLIHHHQGVIGLHTNNPKKSLTHFREFTNMLRKMMGGDKIEGGEDKRLGVAWNELGNALLQSEHYAEADECFVKSIDAFESLSCETLIDINMPMINLAFCRWLQGRLEEAGQLFEEALEVREHAYGRDGDISFV